MSADSNADRVANLKAAKTEKLGRFYATTDPKLREALAEEIARIDVALAEAEGKLVLGSGWQRP